MLALDAALQHGCKGKMRKLVDLDDALDGQAAGDCPPI